MNNDYNKRDMIIFGEKFNKDKYSGGIRYFEQMPYGMLYRLVCDKFADPKENQNC